MKNDLLWKHSTMSTWRNTWKHDPTEAFSPRVYRRGYWHFQAHPVLMLMCLSTCIGVAAPFVFPAALDVLQFMGLSLGLVMTLIVASYHLARRNERLNHMPHMTPYTIGIFEHLTVLGFMVLLTQIFLFN
jgi:hypothetical protein